MPTFDDFRPCKEVPPRGCRWTGVESAHQSTIRAFLRSGVECARYECESPSAAKSYASSLRNAAKGRPVTVSVRARSVYLSKGAPR